MKNIKSVFIAACAAALLLGTVALADSPKSYNLTLGSPAMIGSTQLQAGDYKIIIDEPKARLI